MEIMNKDDNDYIPFIKPLYINKTLDELEAEAKKGDVHAAFEAAEKYGKKRLEGSI